MKIIALDFGARRIGLAIGDTDVGVAASRDFLTNDADTIENITELVERESIDKILIGLPRGLQHETAQTEVTRDFAKKLDAKVSIPLKFIDERFTSRIAEANLQTAEINSRKQKSLVDSEAARIILQEYLDESEVT